MLEATPLRPYIAELYDLTDILEAHENKRHKILEFMSKAPCLCFMKSGDTGKFEYVNKAFCQLVQKMEEEIIGRTALELFDLKVAQRMVEYDLQVLKTRMPVILLNRVSGKIFLVSKFLIVNGGDSIGGFGVEIPDTFVLEITNSRGIE
jgi:PAS domain-containing protein